MPDLLRKFLPYFALLKPVKGAFVGALVCGVIYGVASGFGFPFIAYKVLPVVFGEAEPDTWTLVGALSVMPAAFLVRGVSGFFNHYLAKYCGTRVLIQIQGKMYRRLQYLPLRFFEGMKVGDLMARVVEDAVAVQTVVTTSANDLLKQPIQFLGAIGALVYMAFQKQEFAFLLLALGIVPICVVPIRYMGRHLLRKVKRLRHGAGDLSTALNENLGAVREVRAFNLQELEMARFDKLMQVIARFALKATKYEKMLPPIIELLAAFGVSLGMLYAARVRLSVDDLLPLLTALYMTYDPVRRFGTIHNQIKRGEASVDRIESILKVEDDVPDPGAPVPFDPSHTQIEFRSVTFGYNGTPVLKSIDALIDPGTVMALVGPSGAGKSTFVSLIPRFYDVDEGRISIGGTDLRNFRKNDLRAHISIVSQDTVLFNDTIRSNIRLGRLGATDEEVEEAAKRAFAHDFIVAFEHGYDTMVGERGARLSGGQKQRIAIARAFLRDAPILILDEATSALDSESEEMVQRALAELVLERTVFIIAHRFSTLRLADHIMVFSDGVIDAAGTHDELYGTNALYRGLYDRQFT